MPSQQGSKPMCIKHFASLLSTPSEYAKGSPKMISLELPARQPIQEAWSMEHLLVECSIMLGMLLDDSTHRTYFSHLNYYLNFCHLHHFPIEPNQSQCPPSTSCTCPSTSTLALSKPTFQASPPNPSHSSCMSEKFSVLGLSSER